MTKWWQGIIAVGGLLVASTAGAQVVDGRGNPYRQWDIAVGGSLHFDREVDRTRPDPWGRDWEGGVAVQVDAGRYLTSHVKTEVSFAALTGRDEFWSEPVATPGGIGQAFYHTDIARKQVGAALTYQFFDNVFAHPYVSAGARATLHDRRTSRDRTAWVYDRTGGTSFQVPPFEGRDLDVLVRPYVAAGFKSYFNERSFIRSELSTAYADSGIIQWTLRLGFGVDF